MDKMDESARAYRVREPLVFVWRNSRFNIGISDYNTEEGLSPKRLLTFSFLTLKRVFLISLL